MKNSSATREYTWVMNDDSRAEHQLIRPSYIRLKWPESKQSSARKRRWFALNNNLITSKGATFGWNNAHIPRPDVIIFTSLSSRTPINIRSLKRTTKRRINYHHPRELYRTDLLFAPRWPKVTWMRQREKKKSENRRAVGGYAGWRKFT